jgi:hypothetical protein
MNRTDRLSPYKWHANPGARKKPFGINRKKLIAALCAKDNCCHPPHPPRKHVDLLCSAKK